MPENINYGFTGKWSKEIEEYGFTQIPNLLLHCHGHLGLTDGEMITLIHLLIFRFHEDSKVYPSILTLAGFSLKGYSTIQKRLKDLEDKGFIERIQRYYTSNIFNLEPCVIKLMEHHRICENLPRKRAFAIQNLESLDLSFLGNKEYEFLKRRNLEDIGISTSTSSSTLEII